LPLVNAEDINCDSDARSGSVIEDRIRPALEVGHAMGSTKPVLVVIDEIDGATADNVSVQRRSGIFSYEGIQKQGGTNVGFINKLIGLTMDPPKNKSACSLCIPMPSFLLTSPVPITPGASGARSAKRPLLRPVICICNDLYAPPLSLSKFT
jgi:chromosome transmission fidelity protein 18